ncbi:lamin tail domain-containing protein [Anatilimnocola sp. NA78]|uniref:lamin tail domain-containing protein n=1 Tax=Anatilimnocola sp. NA78 TaxID=3415683 RepID=UPI003CE59317
MNRQTVNLLSCLLVILGCQFALAQSVVINEIHYHPAQGKKTEFIELHNAGATAIDLTGWRLQKSELKGSLPAGGYLVLAADPAIFQQEFGVPPGGQLDKKLSNAEQELTLVDAQGKVVDQVRYQTNQAWPSAADGDGSSLERVNPQLPAAVPSSWRSSGYAAAVVIPRDWGGIEKSDAKTPADKKPTPGKQNSCFAANAPPAIIATKHEPLAPKPDQPVLVLAKIEDADGIAAVKLLVQAVAPGEYLRRTDPAYEKNWTPLEMRDDGQQGDVRAADGIFTAQVPPRYQQHRALLRTRIAATDKLGNSSVFPYADDPSPNRGWFCYAGVPAWTGAREPGKTERRTFSAEFLSTIEPYHLIARREDIETSQWDGGAHKKRFPGSFVYRGQLYDHIQFHNRGQGSAHISGKNKWGLKFGRHHPVHFPGNREAWSGVDLNPGTYTPYIPIHRGISGLDEALSFRAYQLAGVPSSSTHWVHFRVVDAAAESNPKDQYDGDLWGLYLAIADMDRQLLDEQQLPDGLVVSIQSGIKHVPEDGSANQQDWEKFHGGMHSNPPEEWWRKNLHLPNYFSFHALNRLLGNVDVRPDGNHGYYRGPDGRWSPIPWDNDMLYVPRHHQPGHIAAMACINHPAIKLEYQARARELLDLFAADASPTGGQVGQLVTDLGRTLSPPGQATNWAQLDEAMWNWHPRFNQKGTFFANPAQGDHFGGRWERTLATPDIKGFERYLIQFCTDSREVKNYAPNDGNPMGYGWGYLAHEAKDDQIPAQPEIQLLSANKPQAVHFGGSAFASPAQRKLAAVEWRVGWHITQGMPGWESKLGSHYEVAEHWRTRVEGSETHVSVPADAFKPVGVCRVRARYWDDTGRVSHWSKPLTLSSGKWQPTP